MKSALLLKVLSFTLAGSVLVGGGVLAGMTLVPQRDAANLIPTPVVGSPVEPIQSAPTTNNMNLDTAVSPQSPATGINDNVNNQMGAAPDAMSPSQPGYNMQSNGNMNMDMNDNWNNQMSTTPDAMPPDQPGYNMQGNGNMNMDMNDNWNNQMGATPNAIPPDQPGYSTQGNGNMGMGGNWEMNGRDNWGMGGMNGNGNMSGNWGMGNGMSSQGTANLAVISPDEAAQAVQVYLASLNNPDLVLAEIVPYGEDYYAHIYQQDSGQYAFSLMVDAYNGQVWPVNGGQ